MTFDDYQNAALRTVNPSLAARDRLLDACAGLSEEAAGVLGLVRKKTFQARDVDRDRLVEELGDVLWCLSVTADALGIRMSEVAQRNQEELAKRHPDGFKVSS